MAGTRVSEQRMIAWERFLRAHAAVVPLLSQELEKAQRVPLNFYDVLLQLSQAPGASLRVGELNERLVLSQSGLSRLIDRMQTAGLVDREADLQDRRGVVVRLTAAGLAALRRAAPVHLAGIEAHFARHLSDEEARLVAGVFQRVLDAAAGDQAS